MSKSDSFKFRDFYCSFNGLKDEINAVDRPYKRQLEIFVEKEKQLIKVNTLILPKNLSLEKVKAIILEYMCREIGEIKADGTVEKSETDQGYVYKSYENFYKREGKCYVAECEKEKNIEEVGITYDGIYEEVCDYLLLCGVDVTKVPEERINGMVEDVFETVDWQLTSSLIYEDYLEGEVADFPDEYFISGKNTEKEEEEICED